METITSIDKEYVAGTYGRFPVELVSGKGSIFTGSDGREYIDMTSGIGVNCFGACDDTWVAAVCAQASRLQHTSNLYYTEPCAKLAKLLCQKTGMAKVFFSNSGAEANECAIKVARKYSAEKKGNQCYTIAALSGSFHGRTLTTLSATGQAHYHELFQPLTPGFVHVQPEDIEGLKATAEEIPLAGILMECIQGEGGVIALSPQFIQAVAELAKEKDIPLIIDEVQTGNGRTGKMYAYMHYGIQPDIVTTAKGLGGGLPIGATLMSQKVQSVLGPGDHGSTYGANPVCCAGAVSVVERLDDAFLKDVTVKADFIRTALQDAPGVEGITGKGLMVGVKTTRPAKDIVNDCIAKGVLCLTAKDKVRLLPPLNIPMELLQQAIAIIKEACAAPGKENA